MIQRNYSYKPSVPNFERPKVQGLWDFYKVGRQLGFGRFSSWYRAWETNEFVEALRKEVAEYISKGYELEIQPNTNKGETK